VERRVRELVAEQRERSTSRPWPVKVRVVAPGHQAASVERAGALTPYAVQVISEAAARAGRGAQLEVTTPASADDAELARIRDEFAPLGRRGIDVTVRREADLRGSLVGSEREEHVEADEAHDHEPQDDPEHGLLHVPACPAF
jgi:hypothetical protein